MKSLGVENYPGVLPEPVKRRAFTPDGVKTYYVRVPRWTHQAKMNWWAAYEKRAAARNEATA